MFKVLPELPTPVQEFLSGSAYKPKEGRIGVTTLLAPTQQAILKRRYHDEIQKNRRPEDEHAKCLGIALHDKLEQIGLKAGLCAEKFITQELLGWKLTGVIDLMEDGYVYDYKLTGAKSFGKEDKENEWFWQLAIYRWLLHLDGVETKGARIVMWVKDFSDLTKLRQRVYPPDAIVCLELPGVDYQAVESFVMEKLTAFIDANELPDDQLPPCTAEEVWAKPDTWAVKRPKGKSASRVLHSEKEAEEWRAKQKKPGDFIIEFRPGRWNRCEGVVDGGPCYCDAAPYCHQFKRHMEEKKRANSS